MSKGRRAADRRRQREGRIDVEDAADPNDDTRLSKPTMARPPVNKSGRTAKGSETRVGGPLPEPAERLKPSSDNLEPTRVSAKPATEQPIGGRLVLVGNEAAGEATLDCTPCLVGRSLKAHIQLDDPTISRRHVQFTRIPEDNLWVIEDMRSSSGTLLNGELLEIPSAIRHGDIITIGQTSFRFLWSNYIPREVDEVTGLATGATGIDDDDDGETTRFTKISVTEAAEPTFMTTKRELTKAEKKEVKKARGVALKLPSLSPMAMAGVLALLLLIVGGTLGGYLVIRSQSDPAQLESQVLVLIEEAKIHIEKRNWDEARLRLTTALSLIPGYPEAESLMRIVKAELEALAALEEAKRLMAAGDFDVALLALAKIPDSSTYAKERDALRAEIYKAEKDRFLDRVEKLIASGDYEEAISLLEDWLEEHPDDPDALALMARIREYQNKKPTDPADVAKAKAAFAVGNREQARIIAKKSAKKSPPAQRFLDELEAFEASYNKGRKALKKKQGAAASAALEKAYQKARKLSAGYSPVMKREVGVQWSNALYLVGVAAIQDGQLCTGALKILRAYGLNPEDTKISGKKRDLERRARAGLERAKAAKATNPARARQIAQETSCLAPARSKTGKALRRIAKGR